MLITQLNKKPETKQWSFCMEWDNKNKYYHEEHCNKRARTTGEKMVALPKWLNTGVGTCIGGNWKWGQNRSSKEGSKHERINPKHKTEEKQSWALEALCWEETTPRKVSTGKRPNNLYILHRETKNVPKSHSFYCKHELSRAVAGYWVNLWDSQTYLTQTRAIGAVG